MRDERVWTAQEDAYLREHYGKGVRSAAQIAADLGRPTRNSVIGRAKRLGLCEAVEVVQTRRRLRIASVAAARRPEKVKEPRAPKPPKLQLNRHPERVSNVVPRVFDVSKLKPLIDLGLDMCRWPAAGEGAETLFCAEPTPKASPYCRACAKRAYQAGDRKRKVYSAGAPSFVDYLRKRGVA